MKTRPMYFARALCAPIFSPRTLFSRKFEIQLEDRPFQGTFEFVFERVLYKSTRQRNPFTASVLRYYSGRGIRGPEVEFFNVSGKIGEF